MPILEVKNIKKNFGSTEVLKGIDFFLESGEVLSIIGSSGSGKTTLLRCLNFLETPDSGKIIVNGSAIFDGDKKVKTTSASIRQNRLHFGLVFQSFNLFPQYTVKQNITLAPRLRLKETAKAKKMALEDYRARLSEVEDNAEALLKKVGLSEKRDAFPGQLSGGQQQRVAIARALALSPDILCFDEPTSALDPELTNEVLQVIRQLRQDGKTMIVVTHEMEFAKNVSDRILFMNNGQAEVIGTPEEIFNSGNERLNAFLNVIDRS